MQNRRIVFPQIRSFFANCFIQTFHKFKVLVITHYWLSGLFEEIPDAQHYCNRKKPWASSSLCTKHDVVPSQYFGRKQHEYLSTTCKFNWSLTVRLFRVRPTHEKSFRWNPRGDNGKIAERAESNTRNVSWAGSSKLWHRGMAVDGEHFEGDNVWFGRRK